MAEEWKKLPFSERQRYERMEEEERRRYHAEMAHYEQRDEARPSWHPPPPLHRPPCERANLHGLDASAYRHEPPQQAKDDAHGPATAAGSAVSSVADHFPMRDSQSAPSLPTACPPMVGLVKSTPLNLAAVKDRVRRRRQEGEAAGLAARRAQAPTVGLQHLLQGAENTHEGGAGRDCPRAQGDGQGKEPPYPRP